MAAWVFALLSKSERLAYSAVWGSLRAGRSATEALTIYRAAGGSIRNQSWYSLFSAVRGIRDQMAGLSGLLKSEAWKATELPWSAGRLTRQYLYTVQMHGVAPRKPGDDAYYVNVSSSTLLTRGEAEQAALLAISEYAEEGFEEWGEPELVSGMRAHKGQWEL